jgi:hypothetical protein
MLLAASSTRAGQVELSIENRIGGDSNVFRSEDPIEDGTHEISPRIAVRDDVGNIFYSADYQPTYRTFFRTSGIDGLDHVAHARAGWSLTSADRIEASGSYANGRQFVIEPGNVGNVTTFDVNDRERIRQSDASIGYRHSFSQRWSTRLDGFLEDFDASGTDDQSQIDSRAWTGRIATQYALDPLTEVGVTVSGRLRDNRAVGRFRVSSTTDVWDVMGSVSRRLTPTINVSIQAGPSFIRQQQVPRGAVIEVPGVCDEEEEFVCVPFNEDESRDVTLFASAAASKEWKSSEIELSYVRSEARSGNVQSSSSIADRVQLDLVHRFDDRWTVRAGAAWDRLDQIFEQQGDSGKVTLTSYRTTESVEFALSRRVLLIGQYTFFRQENDFSGGGDSNAIDFHVGFVSVRFTFEPISY